MRALRMRHIALLLGVALLLVAVFVPWMTIYVWYYPGAFTMFVWSPFDILWNVLVSAFPNAPEVNAWFIHRASMLVICSALYLGSALAIAGFAIPLTRGDMRRANVEPTNWLLLAAAGLAGFMTLLIWGVVPYFYEIADGYNIDIRAFEGSGTIGIAFALAGSLLAIFSLCAIASGTPPREELAATEP